MVDFVREATMRLDVMYRELGSAVKQPSISQLTAALNAVHDGNNQRGHEVPHCVECSVRLPGNIQGELNFMRTNTPRGGSFCGWIVQLTTSHEIISFMLATMDSSHIVVRRPLAEIELFGCLDRVDSRCLLSHQELIKWVTSEFSSGASSARYRWIDFTFAPQG